jgi:putative endonuclease
MAGVSAPFWFVYVLRSTTMERTYVGVALDVAERLQQHNGERAGGAKSTRAGRPWEVAALYGPYANRADAQRVEQRIKRLRGAARLELLPGIG